MERLKFVGKVMVFVIAALLLAIGMEYGIPDEDNAERLLKGVQNGAELVYFGDSVISYSAPSDLDKRPLNEIVGEKIGLKTISIDQGAFHLGIEGAYVDFLARQESEPEVIVVPINLRAFGPQWDARPGYQFRSEIYRLEDGRSQSEVLWDRVVQLSDDSKRRAALERAWLKEPVFFNTTKIGVLEDFNVDIEGDELNLEELIRRKFIYNYGSALDPTHRRLDSLEHIIHSAKKADITIMLYITPIDYQKGREYLGPSFLPIVKQNANIIKQRAAQQNITVHDFSLLLDSAFFSYRYIPDEHLSEKGKKELAGMVADAIREELAAQQKE